VSAALGNARKAFWVFPIRVSERPRRPRRTRCSETLPDPLRGVRDGEFPSRHRGSGCWGVGSGGLKFCEQGEQGVSEQRVSDHAQGDA